jgi:hypothetical protein
MGSLQSQTANDIPNADVLGLIDHGQVGAVGPGISYIGPNEP